jgi:cytidylate kinase
MPERLSPVRDPQPGPERQSPLHGFRGDRQPGVAPFEAASLTIAISREAGSRGASIAKRAGEKLGWQVYTQEMLEYIAQEATVREELIANLTPAALHWVEEQLGRLQADKRVQGDQSLFDMARVVLALGGTGEVLLIGRGAGCILPRPSTLHVRVIAPLEDRIAYMGQWQRLTRDEAAEQVRLRDRRRAEYLRSHFRHDAADIYQYDLLVNSTFLGEELSAELLVQAARAKVKTLLADNSP